MKSKSNFQTGLEHILNNNKTNFINNNAVFHEIHKSSGMPLSSMIKHIGKRGKGKKDKEPDDSERSKERLETLEEKSS
jgi:hypothetical protein